MENESLPILLITANVGSVFEDPSNLLHIWIKEFLEHIAARQPAFIALHLQEVGGKTYEKSMEYVQEFIKQLCESEELRDYNRIQVYLDEDYNSAEHFTALGNLYFVQRTVNHVLMWNFLTHEWDTVEGKNIHTGSIETIATKEKAKFPQQFFPECKWSRKGFLRTRWFLNGTVFDLVNIHLFHDASNLEACEEYPSVYCKSRRRALVHTLERFHKDTVNRPVPYFVFGDFNFRCDTEGVIKKLTEDLTMHRVQNTKNDSTKVQYRDATGTNVLTVGKKEFFHCDQSTFKENWLRQFDRELDSLRSILYEFPITFPPSYPYEEDPFQPGAYMATRCPAWCDRILVSPAARKLICDDVPDSRREDGKQGDAPGDPTVSYGIIGANVCMGDHKPVYLSIRIKTSQGIVDNCSCDTHVPRKLRVEHPIYNNSASMDSSSNNNTIVVSLSSYGSNGGNAAEVRTIPPKAELIRQLASTAAQCSVGGSTTSASIIPFASSLDVDSFAYHQLHYPSACSKCAARIERCYEQNLIGLESVVPMAAQANQQHRKGDEQNEPNQAAPLELLSQACFRYQHPLVSINVFDTDSNLNVCMCALYCNNANDAKNLNAAGAKTQRTVDKAATVDDIGTATSATICPNCRNIIKHQPIEHRKTLISRRMMLANDVIVNRIDTHYLNTYSMSQSSNGTGQLHAFEPYTPESAESHSPLPESSDSSKASQSTSHSDANRDDDDATRVSGKSTAAKSLPRSEDELQPLVPSDSARGSDERNPGTRKSETACTTTAQYAASVKQHEDPANDANRAANVRLPAGHDGSFGGVSPRQLKSRLEKLFPRLADERRKQYGEWTRSFSQSDTTKRTHTHKCSFVPNSNVAGDGNDAASHISPLSNAVPSMDGASDPSDSTALANLLPVANSNHLTNDYSTEQSQSTAHAAVNLALGPDGKVGELTAQEFLDRLQEYTDLNTRIHDQQQEQLDTSNLTILHSQYVKITPIEPDEQRPAGGNEPAATGGSTDDTTDCHGEVSGSCSALIFRETTV
uniref:inositol-polyphosphate 5-phosphatase n=1 Tax=Anopheles culicifacies TaxID=139723 RepID=A0A182MV50_9DIPT